MRVAHFAFDFSFRDQGGNGVDDDDIDSTAADQFFCDFKGLFAVIRLGNEQFVGVDAKVAGIDRIEACSASMKLQCRRFSGLTQWRAGPGSSSLTIQGRRFR